MNRTKKPSEHFFSNLVSKSIKSLSIVTNQRTIFPFYHIINNSPPIHIKHLYAVKNEIEFKRDLDQLLKVYTPLTPDEFVSMDAREIKQKNYFVLTFDDGLRECHDIIMPILKEKGVPAIFFITTYFLNNETLFHRHKVSIIIEKLLSLEKDQLRKSINEIWQLSENASKNELTEKVKQSTIFDLKKLDTTLDIIEFNQNAYLKAYQPYLSNHQVKTLISEGFSIGAHSLNHPEYWLIPLEERVEQTIQSLQFIRNEFSTKSSFFAFPFTDYGIGTNFFSSCFSSDLSFKAVTTFGTSGIKKDPERNHFHRVCLEHENKSVNEIILKEYIKYIAKSILGKNTRNRSQDIPLS